jgi:hypothetical protein
MLTDFKKLSDLLWFSLRKEKIWIMDLEGHRGKWELYILRYRLKALRKATVWEVGFRAENWNRDLLIRCRSAYTRPQHLLNWCNNFKYFLFQDIWIQMVECGPLAAYQSALCGLPTVWFDSINYVLKISSSLNRGRIMMLAKRCTLFNRFHTTPKKYPTNVWS